METTLKISEARKALFELVDRVTREEASVVWIEHRDKAEQAALVSARHLRSLYSLIDELRQQTKPFALAGSMRLQGAADDLDTALAQLRNEQGERSIARFRDP